MSGTYDPPGTWAELSEWKKHEAAVHLVSHLLYAPSTDVERTDEAILRRKRAAEAMLARAAAKDIDAFMASVVASGARAREHDLKALAQMATEKWQPEWMHSLYHAESSAFYNKTQFRKVWPKLVNLYLIAVALVRQRYEASKPNPHQGEKPLEQPGLRRAIWLVVKSYPKECVYRGEPKGLEALVDQWQPAWPLVCGLLHSFAIQSSANDGLSPIHALLPHNAKPKARAFIRCFTAAPGTALSVAEFFKNELSASGKVPRQAKPPLDRNRCWRLPEYQDLQIHFSPPSCLTQLTTAEISLAKSYGVEAYNALRKSRD